MIGDLETHDRTCRRLAVATSALVIAVDYRRAPEHQWPAAVEDGLDAVQWVASELGCPTPVIAGDSAGGHLALLVAVRLRDLGDGCGGLLLACPNTDLRLNTRSVDELGRGWGATSIRCGGPSNGGFLLVCRLMTRSSARYLRI